MNNMTAKTDILAVNPGSTTTKVGVFRCEKGCEPVKVFEETITHDPNELLKYDTMPQQIPYRKEVILEVLKNKGYDLNSLRAVVGRGGLLMGLKSGGYEATPQFCEAMLSPDNPQHASNLGASLAYDIAEPLGVKSFIYDSPMGCELLDVAKVSGFAELERYGAAHVLNARAQAINYAKSIGKEYKDMNLIVAHMGGGITVSAHKDGKIVESASYDEGPMSPERTGGIPLILWTKMCCSGKYTEEEALKIIAGKGGIYSYLGVTDGRIVEKMVNDGDEKAALVYEAMAYQVAQSIALTSVALKGKVDGIIMTGGLSHSKMLVEMIKDYAPHIGEYIMMPGEDELKALVSGAARILDGEEEVNEF